MESNVRTLAKPTRTLATPTAYPKMRPVRPIYMYTGEISSRIAETVAIYRTDTYVGICVRTGSPTAQVASDIAGHLYATEGRPWLAPFGHNGPIDLAAIRADPVRALGTRITSIPSYGKYVPFDLRVPWAPWLYN